MRSYRADVVGSLLRPDYLLKAREVFTAGRLGHAEFKRIEDRAVDEAIALQEGAGVDVVTDGEMRRDLFLSQLVQATDGFERLPEGVQYTWYHMDGRAETGTLTFAVTSKIRRRRHLSGEEFAYLRGRTRRPTKITLPSPTMFCFYWVPGRSEAAYPSADAYLADVTDILREEVAEQVRLGAEYIQIDAPEFGILLEPGQQAWFASKGFPPDRVVEGGVDMVNAMIAGHPGVTFGLHICRGNNASRYMAKGGYGAIADRIFRRTRAQRLLLEYDDERSGDFAPLARVPEDKWVVLGLITTKTDRLETAAELRARIAEAAGYVPLERLALSPQCGFASVARGNAITPNTQERKLRLTAEVAGQTWAD